MRARSATHFAANCSRTVSGKENEHLDGDYRRVGDVRDLRGAVHPWRASACRAARRRDARRSARFGRRRFRASRGSRGERRSPQRVGSCESDRRGARCSLHFRFRYPADRLRRSSAARLSGFAARVAMQETSGCKQDHHPIDRHTCYVDEYRWKCL